MNLEVMDLTNSKGREFIKTWLNGEDLTIVETANDQNWFYVIYQERAASLPYYNSTAGPSFFGNLDYLTKFLKGQHNWQRNEVHPEPINELEYE